MRAILAISMLVLAAAVAAPTATAIPEPNVGCGGEVVEVCVPVCVTDPCPAYVCVHTPRASVCQDL